MKTVQKQLKSDSFEKNLKCHARATTLASRFQSLFLKWTGLFFSTIPRDSPTSSSTAYVPFSPLKLWTLAPAKSYGRIRFCSLLKLRLDVDHDELASTFKIDLPTVKAVLTTWVYYMYDQLSQLSTWLHRDVIFQSAPEGFKQDFPNTFAILKLIELKTELKSEGPESLHPDAPTCDITLKSLIACDPRGVVMYVSNLFPGS